MTEQKVYYKKVRDLGQVFGAAFGFIKQNFKPLYGSLLFFAGPFLLIVATVSAISFGSTFAMNRLTQGGLTEFYESFLGAYLTIILVSLIGMTVFTVVLNKNVIENESLQQDEKLTIGHSLKNLWTDFSRILGNTLLLGITLVGAFVVLAIIFGGVIAVFAEGGGGGAGAAIMIIFGVILLLAGMLILGPMLMFVPTAAIFVCQRDRVGIFPAIGKVFRYMKNNFWITWAVSFIGILTYSTMGSLVQAPAMILNLISTFSRMKTLEYGSMDTSTPIAVIVVTAICSLLSYGVLVIYHLIAIYQFTNLEEKKEGQSILEKINQI